jgi:hypothetical protein
MKRILFIGDLVGVVVLFSIAMASGRDSFAFASISALPSGRVSEKPATIPLNEIWAYNMPKTRDVGALDAVRQENGVTKHPLVKEIVRSLASKRPKKNQSIGPALIVQGAGKEALRNARDVLTDLAKPSTKFSTTDDLALVFYTSLGGPYAHIDSVERSGRTIAVRYRLLSHNSREDTLHFALIPLGTLGPGNYEVKVELLGVFDETGARKEPSDKSKSFVCSNSNFGVTEAKP